MSTDAVCTIVLPARPDNSTLQINSHKLSVTDVAVNPAGEIRTCCRSGSKARAYSCVIRNQRLSKVHAAQDPTLGLGVSPRENPAEGNRTRRTAVRRSHLVQDWNSRSFLLRGAGAVLSRSSGS